LGIKSCSGGGPPFHPTSIPGLMCQGAYGLEMKLADLTIAKVRIYVVPSLRRQGWRGL
jgi:hypothetical protein